MRIGFRCYFCQKAFKKKGDLNVHTKRIHEKIKDVQCEVCFKRFGLKDDLKKHMEIHNPDTTASKKMKQCKLCKKWLSCQISLNNHKRHVHSNSSGVKCPKCSQISKNEISLKKHLRAMHKSVQEVYKCELCPKEFNQKRYLTRHFEEKHKQQTYSLL